MVTYLPTILMNLINQATSYIQVEGKCSLVITVKTEHFNILTFITFNCLVR